MMNGYGWMGGGVGGGMWIWTVIGVLVVVLLVVADYEGVQEMIVRLGRVKVNG